MKKIVLSTSLLLLSSTMAFAQMMPAGPGTAPGGRDGATPTQNVGNTSATVKDLGTGQTQSTTMLSQKMKNESQASGGKTTGYNESVGLGNGADPQRMAPAGAMSHNQGGGLTDEYGFKYDAQGQRIR